MNVKWHRPEDHAGIYAGDRILCVIPCRLSSFEPMEDHLFVLTATETGWESEDGWRIEDCERWAFESEVLAAVTASL